MDRLIYASLSHTHYWYEVSMLKVHLYLTNTTIDYYCRLLLYLILQEKCGTYYLIPYFVQVYNTKLHLLCCGVDYNIWNKIIAFRERYI